VAGGAAATGGPIAASSCFESGGSAFIMLTAGIEAADGNSNLLGAVAVVPAGGGVRSAGGTAASAVASGHQTPA